MLDRDHDPLKASSTSISPISLCAFVDSLRVFFFNDTLIVVLYLRIYAVWERSKKILYLFVFMYAGEIHPFYV